MDILFTTSDAASVAIDDTYLTYETVTYRREGVAPGDCRQYITNYENLEDVVRPDHEYIVFELTITFDDVVPDFLYDLDETGDDCALAFSCKGHRIDGVEAQVHDISETDVTVAGTYDLEMP